ncbi:hypothetical protein [Sporolactobacillus vineae]|uniref:hypothetical protein n=1 Tax=Sporolactobacillus vineae TaxID=444463 RepID=UPI000289E10A|nr:hypothetical protein [Sporolactobacillus vineae]
MNSIVKNLDLFSRGIWFPITAACFLILFVLFMKKKYLNWTQIYVTYGIIGLTAWMLDTLTGVFLDLYDVGKPSIGLADFIAFAFIPSSLSVIFLNFRTKRNKWLLTALFTLISLIIYWVSEWAGYFKDKGWNSIYSLIAFILVYTLLLPLHGWIIRRPDRENRF